MSSSVRIVAFGDSITRGDNVEPHQRFTHIAQLELARRTGKEVVVLNAGVNSDITTLALGRLERDVLSHEPDLVTVMFGVNDAGFYRPDGPPAETPRVMPDRYEENLERMVRAIRAAGAAPLLGTPLPMSPSYGLRDLPLYRKHGLNYLVDQYAEIVRSVGACLAVPIIDLHRAFAADPSTAAFLPDGIHPTAAGHAFIARLYVAKVLDVLGACGDGARCPRAP